MFNEPKIRALTLLTTGFLAAAVAAHAAPLQVLSKLLEVYAQMKN